MAQFGLCRFVRSTSGLFRLKPRNDRLFSTCNNEMLFGKLKPASLGHNNFLCSPKTSLRTVHQYTRKVIPELPASAVLQNRSMSSSGDHVRLWQIERVVSAAFIALLPGCIILQNPIVDGLFAILVVMHAHWGLEAVIVDYARPIVVGPVLPKVAFMALYLLSAITFVGLLQLIYNGPGIGKTIKKFWAIGSTSPA